MIINKHHCYYCGDPVDPKNSDQLGRNTIWICDSPQCHKEHGRTCREVEDEERSAEEQKDSDDRYYRRNFGF